MLWFMIRSHDSWLETTRESRCSRLVIDGRSYQCYWGKEQSPPDWFI